MIHVLKKQTLYIYTYIRSIKNGNFNKIGDTKRTFHAHKSIIKDRNGKDLTE